ncbi:MAG: cob(I)yrinic acid a,c-diamide adenosyltransferase [Euryarchaeota archaeon]|nr:cob(I)yrinic acid a,c-diamide adenosyltransferase [Euryarchaeota archaeon]
MEGNDLGLLHVYTGDGKGKTTAALGLALRAWGHGMRVCIIQFMKRGEDYGEVMAMRRLNVEVFQFGSGKLIMKGKHCQEDLDCASRALELASSIMASGEFDVVILDEINVAISFDLLRCCDVLDALRTRASDVEVICTGRNAPEELRREADLVTVMTVEKHPYDGGLNARKGIEY